MRIISQRNLGDTVHVYNVIKSVKTQKIYLITNPKWYNLFDSDIIKQSIDDDQTLSIDGYNLSIKLIKNDNHIRDRLFMSINQPVIKNIIPLKINPTIFKKPTVMLCYRSKNSRKEWHGNWIKVEHYLLNLGYDVIYDNPEDSVELLAANIAGTKFIVSVDSAPVHIADTHGIPVIGLYGLTKLKHFGPYLDFKHSIERNGMERILLEDIFEKINILTCSKLP